MGEIIVLGGGLAGLAAAVALADRGSGVTLVERRPYLGGRASSFFAKRIGEEVDIGQHVFMRCCSTYIDFLKRIGAWDLVKLQPRLSVEVRSREGRVGSIEGSALPGPLYLLPSFLRYPFLTPREKFQALRTLLAALVANRAEADGSFHDWLIEHRQAGRMIARFWDFLVLPTLNDRVGEVSAEVGLMVLQEAFFKGHGADIGYARVELSRLAAKAADYIRDRGGRILLSKGAKLLLIEEDRVRGVGLSDGQILNGDLFVSALPPDALLRVLPESWRTDPFFARARKLRWNPIVNLHLWFDRPVMEKDKEFIAFLDSPVQWVFNRSKILGRAGPGQELCLSQSGAWELIDLPPERVLQKLLRELDQLFPHMEKVKLEKYLVTKQHRATVSLAPGLEEYRLPHRTPIKNLLLAGDWTDTGWPSTMEGAVRSGIECARNLITMA